MTTDRTWPSAWSSTTKAAPGNPMSTGRSRRTRSPTTCPSRATTATTPCAPAYAPPAPCIKTSSGWSGPMPPSASAAATAPWPARGHLPHIDARLKRSSKCDGCRDRLVDGGQPVCVEACPLRALEFGLTSELTDRHPDAVRSILPLPDESATRPNLLILPSPAAERAEKQGGSIVNRTELHL